MDINCGNSDEGMNCFVIELINNPIWVVVSTSFSAESNGGDTDNIMRFLENELVKKSVKFVLFATIDAEINCIGDDVVIKRSPT